ncbi:tRNA modification GTPase MnmE [bacterium BMS3Abin07]|nr:tRNA modification GTPase MnmE [bacterium BMS3Abin07]GBE33205.1 tRNA modification GTPase MnmE [bacterium BMS3Bbin05]HDL19978.1 tRNA uridine-5-carboxymethylaminomethyl(34) synthesis GTPase MnmE [Nitrospirota bacterium]HDO21435.1 tRNA uridine-5-carboxymethylaminomethyl(34) synthesis GTPase MnmE [Nitrospirota bacterium]HDZ88925.1 tRNA uridine-5-carboxymethylaminomethyl(34) synthesis GTPase MnmE [Nitrospirota bacterium]
MYEEDTIAAISTPLGEGGIGIVRLSGADAVRIADKLFVSFRGKKLSDAGTHTILYGAVKDPISGEAVDEVLVSVMHSPHTYTREDVVEINCHGGVLPLRNVLGLVVRAGARLAMPGEFTQRAFLNGRIDLVQAEAVIDVIRSKTDESRRIALEQLSGGLSDEITGISDKLTEVCAHIEAYLDFPEDGIAPDTEDVILAAADGLHNRLDKLVDTYEDGRFFREGLSVAIVGRPNVGKSSLLNALLERERAIVTDTPGTTRDVIEEYLNINGLPVRIIDTAGIRESHLAPEREGVRRSLRAIDDADLVIAVFDGSSELNYEDREVISRIEGKKAIIAVNKTDLPAALKDGSMFKFSVVRISAKQKVGIGELRDTIVEQALKGGTEHREGVIITNMRHKVSIESARDAVARGIKSLKTNHPLEIIAIEFRDALRRLGEVVGVVTTDDILNKIFSDFCIGK